MTSVHPDLQALIERKRAELGLGGQPMSIRGVARRATERGHRLSPETVRQLANGTHSGRIDDLTVDGLASALGVSRAEVLRAMHETRQQSPGPWQLPPSAERLTLRQRRVIEQLIQVMSSPSAAENEIDLEVVDVGDEGMRVVQAKGAGPMSEDDRLTNEAVADQELDRMAKRAEDARRFGRG